MISLFHDPHFTFSFEENRIIPRIHLEGIEAGRPVAVFQFDLFSSKRLGLLAKAIVGKMAGWNCPSLSS